MLAVLAIVITVFVARALRQATDRWTLVGLVLVLGGALGNLVDRLARSPGFLRGHVVDFVAVGWFPVFNVADSCITIGAIVLIVRTLFAPAAAPVNDRRMTARMTLIRTARSRSRPRSTAIGSIARSRSSPAGRAPRCRSSSTRARCWSTAGSSPRAIACTRATWSRCSTSRALDVRRPARAAIRRSRSTCVSPTTTSWSSPSRPVSWCIPGAGHAGGTLVNGLLARFPGIETVGDPMRPGIVHRLDRDTSGLLAVARSPRAYDSLVAQLAARTVERVYTALVWGRLVVAARDDRRADRSFRRAAHAHGGAQRGQSRRAPSTRSIETFDRPVCSLLECTLETGRTHQIRVHLAAIGHPVVGDGTYGGSRDQIALARPFLHAAHARVRPSRRPANGCGSSEPLPAELQAVLDDLGERDR